MKKLGIKEAIHQNIMIKNRIFYIKNTINPIRFFMLPASGLPEYPKTEVRGSTILILYENGSEEIWGYEPNPTIAAEVAHDIELGLKSIDYVAFEITKRLTTIATELATFGVPPEYTGEYIEEGYSKVEKWFNRIEQIQSTTY